MVAAVHENTANLMVVLVKYGDAIFGEEYLHRERRGDDAA